MKREVVWKKLLTGIYSKLLNYNFFQYLQGNSRGGWEGGFDDKPGWTLNLTGELCVIQSPGCRTALNLSLYSVNLQLTAHCPACCSRRVARGWYSTIPSLFTGLRYACDPRMILSSGWWISTVKWFSASTRTPSSVWQSTWQSIKSTCQSIKSTCQSI